MSKLIFVLLFLWSLNVQAQKGDQYILPKYGQMAIALNNASNLESVGLMYGYGLSKHFSMEGELNLGFKGGDYVKTDGLGNVTESGEYRVTTLAAYPVFRKSLWDTAYLKAKLGVLYEEVERSTQTQSLTDSSVGIAGGGGLGAYLFDTMTLELEATLIDRDIIFYSLGAHIKF